MSTISRYLLVLGFASLCGPFLADRAEEELQATYKTLAGFEEKQKQIMGKLMTELEAGRLDAATKSKVAGQLENYRASLEAELQRLQNGEIPYIHTAAFADDLKKKKETIGEAIGKITEGMNDLITKSVDYQHNNYVLQDGVAHFEKDGLATFQRRIGDEKARELADLKSIDFTKAFTDKDRQMLNHAQMNPDDEKFVTSGIIPREQWIKDQTMGSNPYTSMSKGYWSDDSPYQLNEDGTPVLGFDGSKKEKEGVTFIHEDEKNPNSIFIKIPPLSRIDPPTDMSSSLVEVSPTHLKHMPTAFTETASLASATQAAAQQKLSALRAGVDEFYKAAENIKSQFHAKRDAPENPAEMTEDEKFAELEKQTAHIMEWFEQLKALKAKRDNLKARKDSALKAAKALGITPEEVAKQLIKDGMNEKTVKDSLGVAQKSD